ncbi:nuclease [Actinoplanes sp. DH11]|uniref:nuclease n=1 Tax=Actinoplanes sp. DH11 TaxID=2857011 RepID=UPI001E286E15|nr:nuclease [Actinoplanes sp. DH11]
MSDPIQVFWAPAGASMPTLGDQPLIDITDGDTPNLRMPVRMLSVDTPEVTARSAQIDEEFAQLAEWIRKGQAPIDAPLAEFLLPKMETGRAGTWQFQQGQSASAFAKSNVTARLARPHDPPRNVFIRIADTPFDSNHRLLAYLAPDYTEQERRDLPRHLRPTFNLDLLTAGWAAPFVIHPAIPGAEDLALLIQAAGAARTGHLGIWAEPETLLAYEYRALEKLFRITRARVRGDEPTVPDRSWRERYCADMRTRVLHGPEDYFGVEPEYRLWLWPADLRDAVSSLNLTPSPRLVTPA